MSEPAVSTEELVAALASREGREFAAKALANRLGVGSLLLFARDPTLGLLIPAPGMPQTIRGGKSWRAFLSGCPRHGRIHGAVELPTSTQTTALAIVRDVAAIILVGGEPKEAELIELERMMPLVAALFAAEQDAALARAERIVADSEASRAGTLAKALEAARADAAGLNSELRDEHRRKDEFLAMLGHELRNPLSPLVTSIALLRSQGTDTPNAPRLLEVMDRQTRQLSRLVDDLLDVARVSQGKIELQRKPVLLSDVLADALEESRSLIEAQGHHVLMHAGDRRLTVFGDHARLVQVFGNLLNNAAKYTDPGGTIEVGVESDDKNAVVRIKDTGIGISAPMQARIFDLFAQASVALGRAQGGLGIGLTLVRSLVEMHNGRIAVESGGVGTGSVFSVTLPLAAPVRDPTPTPSTRDRSEKKPLRVLIVDDNRDAADSIAELLRTLGHEAAIAYDAESALGLCEGACADLALLDIGLPGLDGYELARRLRRSGMASARLVALTGFGTSETSKRINEAGFDEHIVKPISPDALITLLDTTPRIGPVEFSDSGKTTGMEAALQATPP